MEGLEKRCLIDVLRAKYRKAGKTEKGFILDELTSKLLVSRKHAIKLMYRLADLGNCPREEDLLSIRVTESF